MFDPKKLRNEFPIFKRDINGKPVIYLDSAATTQKPIQVIEGMSEFYKNHYANVHRGAYFLSEEATYKYEEARVKVGRFIGAESTETIIFTRNATESINLVANSWGRKYLNSGDEILLTHMEHHSNLIPWQMIAKEKNVLLKFIPLTDDGRLDLSTTSDLINDKTKIVSIVHLSNSLGTLNPVEEIISYAHSKNIPVLVDATQSVPHMEVDVQKMDCDFMVFSGHKMLGPSGIGVLYGKVELLDEMPPFLSGGEMIKEVHYEWADYQNLPWKFEAGTPNIVGAYGLGLATDYLNEVGLNAIKNYEQELTVYALDQLKSNDGIDIYGPISERGGIVSFNLKGIHPHDVSTILDDEGIAIRAGHHCTQPLMRLLNVPATVRMSFYLYNLQSDIDMLMDGIKKVKEVFSRVGA